MLDKQFWNDKWENNLTGWDVGHASPAITDFMQTISDKNLAILIPGCGNAYEAEWLVERGFTNITLLDIAPKLVGTLQEKYKDTPQIKVFCEDFYEHESQYDLIVEQTFFCANDPKDRTKYVEKSASLLNENGKIIGVLFCVEFDKQGPPFGGTTSEYNEIFKSHFHILKMENCYNSISPRANTEVFIHFQKR
ncbi:MAG TPA: methyltransferase domain-containing protein [Crocinitomicaceae bacterium]|nr:methyltransferase domain-containing protein [Crocinitomicaceae bacterium]